jgi:uncharacterized protein YoxC
MAPPIVGQLVAYIIGFAFVSLLIAGIILLIRSATCTTSNAENVYEHFDETDDYLANLQKHTKLVRQAMATLQNDMDILDEDTDDTCDIMKSVEDTFISNKSVSRRTTETYRPKKGECQEKFSGKEKCICGFHRKATASGMFCFRGRCSASTRRAR